jgi:indolepyruvate decarboxylase
MTVGEYLFQRLKAGGVGHLFGIPGDFVVPHFGLAEELGFAIVVTTHEPGAGFAADAYARLAGLGAVLTTYGAGALNMVNPIAQAYAEKSPVIVVSGAPEVQGRRIDALFHHRVKTYESQLNVYREITGAAVALNDPLAAAEAIEHVLQTARDTKRPGYIEVPRDVLQAGIPSAPDRAPLRTELEPAAADEALAEVMARLRASRRPVVYAGIETERFRLRASLIALVEKLGVPVVTSIEGKCVFPEDHANFVGIYMGAAGSPAAREQVEASDCLLVLGAFLTDVSTGFDTARINRANVIAASAEDVSVGYHRYPGITLAELLRRLLASPALPSFAYRGCGGQAPPETAGCKGRLRTAEIIQEVNRIVAADRYVVVSDVGDCLYASVDLRADLFLGPGYYNSMGFGVPAGLAVPLARPDRRALVLVGDGAFQMTGLELSTAKRLGQNPIVILFDNGGYAMMRSIGGAKPYFELPAWDYVGLARALGGRAARVETRAALRLALTEAEMSSDFFLIDAVLDLNDVSPAWRRITRGIHARMRASGGRPAAP